MKIIIYALNFKPDLIGVGKYTGELADYLYEKGHELHVITAPQYYPFWKSRRNSYFIDKSSGYKIFRCPIYIPKKPNGIKRIMHLISFSITSFPVLISQFKWNPDCILVIAPSIVCSLNAFIFRLIYRKKLLSLLHIQDFELDAAFDLKILRFNFLRKLFSKLEIVALKNFKVISTISYSMINKLVLKGVNKNKIYYFPNWVDIKSIKTSNNIDKSLNYFRSLLKISNDTVVIQYSGSINNKQGLDFLISIINHFDGEKNILWLVACEGPCKNQLIEGTKQVKNVRFLPLQKNDLLNDWLNSADIHIIPQDKNAKDNFFPSKLLGILASGNPVVSNVSEKSELGQIVNSAGIRVDPKDFRGFINALSYLIKHKSIRYQLGQEGRKIVENKFSKFNILNQFNIFLEDQNLQ